MLVDVIVCVCSVSLCLAIAAYRLVHPSHAHPLPQGARAAGEATGEISISPSSMPKTTSSPSILSSSTDDLSPKDLTPVKLDETHFARDLTDRIGFGQQDRGVQIRVDSSESRTITAAQNFEGLEKSKPGGEESDSPGGGAGGEEGRKLLADGTTAGEAGDGSGRGAEDSAKPRVPAASKEQGRSSSSRLQVQLKEYDLKKMEDEQKREGRVRPLPLLTKPQLPTLRSFPSPVRAAAEGAAVRFSERLGSSGNSPQQAPVRSPDSSSSSSATQVLDD